jgi:5-methylthioadenosine/S-adenosylhomocysteine deaminase
VPVMHGNDFNVPAHLVFTASGHDVAHVWVKGKQLVEDKAVVSVDVTKIARDAQAAAEELFARRAALPDATLSVASELKANT